MRMNKISRNGLRLLKFKTPLPLDTLIEISPLLPMKPSETEI